MNNLVLVGRLFNQPKLVGKNEHKYCNITLAINRYFKNEEGIYETDFIDVKVPYPMCDSVVDYCRKGDTIGVIGVVERLPKYKNMRIVAQKIIFLSSGGGNKND